MGLGGAAQYPPPWGTCLPYTTGSVWVEGQVSSMAEGKLWPLKVSTWNLGC